MEPDPLVECQNLDPVFEIPVSTNALQAIKRQQYRKRLFQFVQPFDHTVFLRLWRVAHKHVEVFRLICEEVLPVVYAATLDLPPPRLNVWKYADHSQSNGHQIFFVFGMYFVIGSTA